MPEILETRAQIRKEKLASRELLAFELREASSGAIADRAFELVEQNSWKTLHCYLAFRSEVLTAPLIKRALASGIRVIVPWVESDGELSHHQLLSLDGLSEGPYGLPHPARNEFTVLDSIDAVFLPLAAFDRSGNRLGYGKGFYDRFLSQLPSTTLRIGLAFAMQEADRIPAMDHDQKLDMIITEHEVISTASAT